MDKDILGAIAVIALILFVMLGTCICVEVYEQEQKTKRVSMVIDAVHAIVGDTE